VTPGGTPAATPVDDVLESNGMQDHAVAAARQQLRHHGLAAALLFDPLNVRYLTGTASCLVYMLHTPERFLLLPVESEPVLWEYAPAFGLLGWRGETRKARSWHAFGAGALSAEYARAFAHEVTAVLAERGIAGERLGLDRLDAVGYQALAEAGVTLADAQLPLELARSVKSPDEIEAHRVSARVCDAGIAALRERLRPGTTENDLWGAFCGAAFSLGAEYAETRLLASGPRTNPWFQEASARVVEEGELVAFDTDLVGPAGYMTDVSRTYLCGGEPSDEQRRLYSVAYEFLHEALPQMRPGRSFEELGRTLSQKLPEEFQALRYPFIAHGVGLADEYPAVLYEDHHPGVIEANMVVSVEAYIGARGGREGVKLEEQVLVTENGFEVFSSAPYDEQLL
jgi:Xaa-Pro dipeptidase